MEEKTQMTNKTPEMYRDEAFMSMLSLRQLFFLGASEEEFAEIASEVEDKIQDLYLSVR